MTPYRLIPPRRYDSELLDDPTVDEALAVRSVSDIVRSNTLFGGTEAVLAELAHVINALPRTATLLDVGTGLGDIPRAVRRVAARRGVQLDTIGVDASFALVQHAGVGLSHGVCGDALHLPFAARSIDIVLASQLLHHFRGDAASALLREMHRVARLAVVVSDLRRSWVAAGGFWAASFPLGFHTVTRHDGVLSVFRGFTPGELAETIHEAVGVRVIVHRRLGFRLTARWVP